MKVKTIKIFILSLLVICFINFIVFIISFLSGNYRTKEKYASVAQTEELRLIRFELQSLNSNLVVFLNKK